MQCVKCKFNIPDGNNYCPQCGEKVEKETIYCEKCGAQILAGNNYCTKCGNKINKNTNNINNEKKLDKKKITYLITCLIIMIVISTILKLTINQSHTRTIMIYMVGSNLETSSSLATSDLESIKYAEMDNKNVKVIVLAGGTKYWNNNYIDANKTAIYELTSSGYKIVYNYDKQENMGNPEMLKSFLNYGYNNYKSTDYDLIIWNHGGATDGSIYDDISNDNITLSDYDQALNASVFSGGKKLESVIFRTCLNGTIEIANIFKDHAKYMVSSEEITLGYPQMPVLGFINDITKDDDGEDYGRLFIDGYTNFVKELSAKVSNNLEAQNYALIKLSEIKSLVNNVNSFFKQIDIEKNYNILTNIRANLYQYAYNFENAPDYDTVDLYKLVDEIEKNTDYDAKKIKETIENTVLYKLSNTDDNNGLSIYFAYRGGTAAKEKLLNVEKNIFNNDYYKFLENYNNKRTGNRTTSYATTFTNKDITTKGNEYYVKLTDQQINDYANSIYTIYYKHKDSNTLYGVAFNSDNTYIEDNKLKTKIDGNLLKIKSISKDTNKTETDFVSIRERKNQLNSFAILSKYNDKDGYVVDNATLHLNKDNNKIKLSYVTKGISISDDKMGSGGLVIDIEDYNQMLLAQGNYPILKEDGTYNPNWYEDYKTTDVYYYKIEKGDKYEFISSKITETEKKELLCVFQITDIYGNTYYTNFANIE